MSYFLIYLGCFNDKPVGYIFTFENVFHFFNYNNISINKGFNIRFFIVYRHYYRERIKVERFKYLVKSRKKRNYNYCFQTARTGI